jgi:soluble lytic murein transglycosylase-like protein
MAISDVMNRIAQLQGQLAVTRRPRTAAGERFAATLDNAVTDRTEKALSFLSPKEATAARNANTHAYAARPAGLTPTTALSGGVSGVPFADLFNAAGANYGVSPKLLAAVARVESEFNHHAVSAAGAQGLMQIMPSTARGLGINAFDPAQAIDGAARILKANLKEFGSIDLALAAYNAGGGAVKKHRGIPPNAETRAYVPKVKAALAALGG